MFVGEIDQTKIIAFTAVRLSDGLQGVNICCSRAYEEYRGDRLYKALLRYTVHYIRESLIDAKYVYRLRPTELRVPNGYDVIKERGLIQFARTVMIQPS